jgi:hypothetical protein
VVQRIGFPEHVGDMIASGLRCSMLAIAVVEQPCAIIRQRRVAT